MSVLRWYEEVVVMFVEVGAIVLIALSLLQLLDRLG